VKTVSDLGERKAIELISTLFTGGDIAAGIGDDCAALEFGEKYLLLTTDMISQKTHIPKEMTPFQIGWFLVAINLSDIASKGGVPLGLVLSFGLPKDTSESYLIELTRGADACATTFDTYVIGGDTKETTEITLCGSALGMVKKEEFMPRTGGKPGDIIAVTGTLGKAGTGFYALQEKNHHHQSIKEFLEPQPRMREGRILAKQRLVHCSMDISDGLSSSLYQLAKLNHVGFELFYNKLPISSHLLEMQNTMKSLNTRDVVLHFGGDYELLITLPKKHFTTVQKAMISEGLVLSAIGSVTREEKIILIDNGEKKPLENKGYEHFKPCIF
jgi:thiamine-monophosphate kinase